MKAEEVVSLLQARLPLFTDKFNNSSVITSLTNPSGNEAIAVTESETDLSVGDLVTIKGAKSNVSISSITRVGIVGELITDRDHDVTNGLKTVELEGSNESVFNDTFNITTVVNRRTIKFTMASSGPTSATGSPTLVDGESVFRGYNGLQTVTSILSTTSFTYDLSASGLDAATGDITANNGIRISSGGTLERLIDAYTKQPQEGFWMFVVLGDVTASKSRNINNDGVDSLSKAQQGDRFRQQIIQPVTVYVFIPTADSLAARKARDECEELFASICSSILFFNFGSGLSTEGKTALTFVNHGFQAYNSAFYVHQYTFEQMADLTFGDTIGFDADTAFRDISLIMNQTTGDETFTADINLDEEALL